MQETWARPRHCKFWRRWDRGIQTPQHGLENDPTSLLKTHRIPQFACYIQHSTFYLHPSPLCWSVVTLPRRYRTHCRPFKIRNKILILLIKFHQNNQKVIYFWRLLVRLIQPNETFLSKILIYIKWQIWTNYYLYIFTKFCEDSMLPLSMKHWWRKRFRVIKGASQRHEMFTSQLYANNPLLHKSKSTAR